MKENTKFKKILTVVAVVILSSTASEIVLATNVGNEQINEVSRNESSENTVDNTAKNEVSNNTINNDELSNTNDDKEENTLNQMPEITGMIIDDKYVPDGGKIEVEENVSSVSVYAKGGDGKYKITVNGVSSSNTVKLTEQTNEIILTGTSGQSVKAYITKKVSNNNEENKIEDEVKEENTQTKIENEDKEEDDDLKLNELLVEGLSLNPSFNPNTYSYTLNININEKNYNSLKIEAKANKQDAEIKIDGADYIGMGENVINIIVSSKDGSQIKIYQIIANKTAETISEQENEDNLIYIIAEIVLVLAIILLTIIIIKNKRSKSDIKTRNLYDYNLEDETKPNRELIRNDIEENYGEGKREKKEVEKAKPKRKNKGKHA